MRTICLSDKLLNSSLIKTTFCLLYFFIFFTRITAKRPCTFYFPTKELKYELTELKLYPDLSKSIDGTFYHSIKGRKLNGNYLINICLEISVDKICPIKGNSTERIPEGIKLINILFYIVSYC